MSASKWQNVSAGPVQWKKLAKAVAALQWEGQSHDELTGVTGQSEDRHSYVTPFSGVRAEVAALDLAIHVKYDNQVTRDNAAQVTADYLASLTEARKSRPVDDKRRTPAEDAALRAKLAEADAAYQAERQAADDLMAKVMAKAPAWATALIVAEYHVDRSDPMTDYFANATTRSVAIGFRSGKREDFRQLHAAAAAFAETAGVKFEERRDNYSMGKGNYLSDHGWDGAGSGWVVKSYPLPARWANLTEDAVPEAAPAPAVPDAPAPASGVTVRPDSKGRPGVVEVKFDSKPPAEVRAELKARRFGWSPADKVWRGRDAEFAASLATAA